MKCQFWFNFLVFFVSFGSASVAQALCVIHNGVSLRSGPGPSHSVTWVVPKYMPVIELKRSGRWYQVEDIDGDVHWVAARNVTSKTACVAVKVNNVKLRTAPNAQSELASVRHADRYTPFKRIDSKHGWYQVEASWGESYWLPETAVWRPIKVSKVNF